MKQIWSITLSALFLAGCATASPKIPTATLLAEPVKTETPTPTLAPTATNTPTPLPTITSMQEYPADGYGPSNFPVNIDPLTGLLVADPSILDRRPLLIKVANLPRFYRPQWGLSKADQVFEYYTEEGSTRFAAVFLGQDASLVGPIRSGRFFDNHLVHMYNANFAFGSADYRVMDLLYNEPYADRLVIEALCPPMCRLEPDKLNYLMTDTVELTAYINSLNVKGGNRKQNLDGFLFKFGAPDGGKPATRVFVRYSAAIYNRWDYDAEKGKYFRFSDTENDFDNGQNEVYWPLTDRLTGEPIGADNLVVMEILHKYISKTPEIVDIVASGQGKAYLFRDGQMFKLRWSRAGTEQLFTLTDEEGKTFPLKPGNTWFEIFNTSSAIEHADETWRFTFRMPE